MEKCGLRTCAQVSYQQAEEQIHMLTGIRMGHSTLHRLVNRTTIPLAESKVASSHASLDEGKSRLRVETDDAEAKSRWKDYKAVNLGNGVYEAFFQDNTTLRNWSTTQPLEAESFVFGNAHDNV